MNDQRKPGIYQVADDLTLQQKPLKLRQIKQLFNLVGKEVLSLFYDDNGNGVDYDAIVTVLGDKMEEFFGIILTRANEPFSKKDLPEFTDLVANNLDDTMFAEIIEDFFTFNRPSLEKLAGTLSKEFPVIGRAMDAYNRATEEETVPEETKETPPTTSTGASSDSPAGT